MGLAEQAATRSADPRTRVGALAVGQDNAISATGYNGLPYGVLDTPANWQEKNLHVIHAEENVVAHAARHGRPLRGDTVYTTMFPCLRCTRMLVQCGIVRVVYLNDQSTGYQSAWLVHDQPHVLRLANWAGLEIFRLNQDDTLERISGISPIVTPELVSP